jgi:hypothetical protein
VTKVKGKSRKINARVSRRRKMDWKTFRKNRAWLPVVQSEARERARLRYRRRYHTHDEFRARAITRVQAHYWSNPAKKRAQQRERRAWMMANIPAFAEDERARDRERYQRARSTPEGLAAYREKKLRELHRRLGKNSEGRCRKCGRKGVYASGLCGRHEHWRKWHAERGNDDY